MKDIELVIRIPEEMYRTLNAKSQNDVVTVIDDALLIQAIKNGKPLDSVLDKIKAEANADCISDGIGRYIRFDVLEKIINKHKAESEE